MSFRWSLLALLLLLAGCAEYWAKPGGTPVGFRAAREACTRQASADYPPDMEPVQVTQGTPSPMVTTCAPAGGSMACTTSGIGFQPPTYTTLDRNTGPRERAFRACLEAAGWQAVRSQQQADAITNSTP
ncbi:MAG: hypothetical protein U1E70_22935 [Acetobacteraceae bacterium]|nr:hypothetical protein [Pseudomonadota bacterium]